MTMKEIQSLLTELMRSIDKKTVVTVEPSKDTNRPGVTVRLSRSPRSRTLELSESDFEGSDTDLLRRNNVRSALKRAHDRMWEKTGYIFETKMISHQGDGSGHWSRPSFGGGRGRR
jgi:hypothetical protein